MSEHEITMARAYLNASDQDPVGALIRSIKDLAHARRMLSALPDLIADLYGDDDRAPSSVVRCRVAAE
jgi:hypothetical protein